MIPPLSVAFAAALTAAAFPWWPKKKPPASPSPTPPVAQVKPATPSAAKTPATPNPTAADIQQSAREIAQARTDARGLSSAGDSLGAAKILQALARRMGERHGETSPQRGAVLAELSATFVAAGDLQGAIETLTQATKTVPNDEQSAKDRLTHLKNLGELFAYMGRFDEAEKTLRDGLLLREKLYGTDHPGYAYGLHALGELYLLGNRAPEALEFLTRARDVCLKSPVSTPLIPDAFAVRAYAALAVGASDADAWEHVESLPQEEQARFAQQMIQFARIHTQFDASAGMEILVQRIGDNAGYPLQLRTQAGAQWLATARRAKNVPAWLRANEYLLDFCRQSQQSDLVLQLLLDRPMALEADGRVPEAKAAYEKALVEAYSLATPKRLASIHRNFAVFLKDQKDPDAARHYKLALDFARKSADQTELASCLTARGIYVQHGGDIDTARPLLEEAVAMMDAKHEFFLYAKNHLNAIQNGGSCGCGNMRDTIAQAINELVRAKLPNDLIKSVDVKYAKGDERPEISVELNREPTPEELELLNTATRLAVAEIRENARRYT